MPRAQEKAFTQHAVARLLAWLGTADEPGMDDAMARQLQRNALWLGFLMVPLPAQKAECDALLGQWIHQLPEHLRTTPKGFAPSTAKTAAISSGVIDA